MAEPDQTVPEIERRLHFTVSQWVGVPLLLSIPALAVSGIERLLEGQATILVRDGRMLAYEMNRERVDPTQLLSEMHKHGLERVDQIKLAILESGGNITFVRREHVA